MTTVTNAANWAFNLAEKTIAWPDAGFAPAPLPDVTTASLVYFGANYLTSQAASRTVSDGFRKAWAEAATGRKAKDAPKSCVPAPDSPEYVAALLKARQALYARCIEGYEVNERAGAVDPYTEELDKLGRAWLQTFAIAKGWYVLPAKKKVARDEDAYADPKGRYATFGDALAAFLEATTDSKSFALTVDGKAWPIKTKPGTSISALMATEAKRRADARDAAKPQAAVLANADGDEADF